jgi:hypothetical protein
VEQVETLFARALLNPMAARRAVKGVRKAHGRKTDVGGGTEVPPPTTAVASAPAPPHNAASVGGGVRSGQTPPSTTVGIVE